MKTFCTLALVAFGFLGYSSVCYWVFGDWFLVFLLPALVPFIHMTARAIDNAHRR